MNGVMTKLCLNIWLTNFIALCMQWNLMWNSYHTLAIPYIDSLRNRDLNRPTKVEIHVAVKQMGSYSASSLDSLPPIFFQKYWDVVGKSIVEFVQQAFQDGEFDLELNKSVITLIPKQSHPESMAQFRPYFIL